MKGKGNVASWNVGKASKALGEEEVEPRHGQASQCLKWEDLSKSCYQSL